MKVKLPGQEVKEKLDEGLKNQEEIKRAGRRGARRSPKSPC